MGDHIGARVRRCRLWRGMTQQQLADLAGWTTSAVSMLETGRRGLDSRTRLRQLADALQVDPAELVDEPDPLDAPGLADVQAGIPALEAALMGHRIGEVPDHQPRPLEELLALIGGPLRRTAAVATDTGDRLALLAGLIVELQSYGTTERALRALTAACNEATYVKRVRQVPLAWIAAERAAEAAALVGDPVLVGAAEFTRAHTRPADFRALAQAGAAADRIPTGQLADEPWAQEVYGMLRLTGALAAQVSGDSTGAAALADEAARVAELHGERPASGWAASVLERGVSDPDPASPTWESFGPANVGVWRTWLAVERGEPARALELAAAVDTAALPSRVRHSDFVLYTARAHHMMGGRDHERQAVAALREAERLALHTRMSPWARDVVHTMLTRGAPVGVGGRELRGLAYRMGLDASS